MNTFLNGLHNATNFGLTENGAVKNVTTRSDVLDMFAMGAAMRNRSNEDVILMFRKAFAENQELALKCLFYIRDIRGGQGERRFFRVVLNDLAKTEPSAVSRNLELIAEYGRWDDLYALIGTPIEAEMFDLIKVQLALDVQCKTPSLLAKWLPSENASSKETKKRGNLTRIALGMSHKQYRQTLSTLRERINVLERLMSAGEWDKIEFDKIPSRAGLIYKNAFARRDIIAKKYEKFALNEETTVNAGALYPYEVVEKALTAMSGYRVSDVDRAMVNKYWANLKDYLNGSDASMIAVVDTSGSMCGTPINVAISLGLYMAERNSGPFANHYISFASKPQLIKTDGIDFVDKVKRIYKTNLVDNTNIEGVFDLMLNTAKTNGCKQEDIPQTVTIISDMEFDSAVRDGWGWRNDYVSFTPFNTSNAETLLEGIAKKWAAAGYEMPHLVFWNVDARTNNIPMIGQGRISYVSGFSPSIFESILSGKTGYELMEERLLSDRYAPIH